MIDPQASPRFHFRIVPFIVAMLLAFGIPYIATEIVDSARHYSHMVPPFADKLRWGVAQHTVLLVLALISIGIAKLVVRGDYGLHGPDERSYAGVALLWGLLFGVLLTAVDFMPNILAHVAPKLGYPLGSNTMLGWLGFNGLYAGTTEEVLFRGFLVTYLSTTMPGTMHIGRYRMNVAGIIAAFLYALYAASFLTAPWQVALGEFFCQFILGVLFAYWLEKSKSILAPIIGHNLSSVTEYALVLGMVTLWA
jgi:hypothetical protein